MTEQEKDNRNLVYSLEGKPPIGTAIVLGMQHVLAMFVGNLTPLLVVGGVYAGANPGSIDVAYLCQCGMVMPLRYNNDKRKKPLFSRGLSVCRHLFNSFSKLKYDEKIIK